MRKGVIIDGVAIDFDDWQKDLDLILTKVPLAVFLSLKTDRYEDSDIHVTDLCNGLRETYLKHMVPHYIKLEEQMAVIPGTAIHSYFLGTGSHLEIHPRIKYKTGVLLRDGSIVGEADLMQFNDNDEAVIIDFKLYGAYAIRKALGVTTRDVPMTDEKGDPVLYKIGPKKGQQKTTAVPSFDPNLADYGSARLQLNLYRYLAMKNGMKVRELKLFVINKESTLRSAQEYSIDKSFYYFSVPVDDFDEIESYVKNYMEELKSHMERNEIPAPCSKELAWGGRKCVRCAVREACIAAGNPYIKDEENETE